jgi:hypothetical protein
MLNQVVLIGKLTMVTPTQIHLNVSGQKDFIIHYKDFIIDQSSVGQLCAVKAHLAMTHHLEIHMERYSVVKGGDDNGN